MPSQTHQQTGIAEKVSVNMRTGQQKLSELKKKEKNKNK